MESIGPFSPCVPPSGFPLNCPRGLWMSPEGTVRKLELPTDVCRLFQNNPHQCKTTLGCAFCSISDSNSLNMTFCYSNDRAKPAACSTDFQSGTLGEIFLDLKSLFFYCLIKKNAKHKIFNNFFFFTYFDQSWPNSSRFVENHDKKILVKI